MKIPQSFRRFCLAVAVFVALVQCSPRGPGAPLRIFFIDTGQGDATLIEDPVGGTALVDAGPAEQGIVGKLRALGVDHLNLAVGTHPDADHIGAMDEVLRAFPPKTYLDPHVPHPTGQFIGLLTVLKGLMEGGKTKYLEPGRRTISLGRVLVEILPSPTPLFEDTNNDSVVVRIVDDEFRALLPGDAGHDEEDWLLNQMRPEDLSADVLKPGHHGSKTATGDRWVDTVQPVAAVISCGRRNSYSFPHKEVLDRLEKRGIVIFRTDLSGTIEVRSWGRGFEVLADGRRLYRSPGFRGRRS